jgi:hypothetical protein
MQGPYLVTTLEKPLGHCLACPLNMYNVQPSSLATEQEEDTTMVTMPHAPISFYHATL